MLDSARQLAFVHIPKTGGTSVELFFTGYDWITNNAADYAVYLRERASYSPTHGGTLCANDAQYFQRCLRHKHATQAELRARCGAQWPALFKFTLLRNPWRRILSVHQHGLRDGHGQFEPDFRRWLAQDEPRDHMGQAVFVPWIDDWQELAFVGRLEQLATDWPKLLARLGLPLAELPHERHGGGATLDVAASYDERSRAVVARRCAAEIRVGGYQFPG